MKCLFSTLLVLALLGRPVAPVAAASTAHPLTVLAMVPNAGVT